MTLEKRQFYTDAGSRLATLRRYLGHEPGAFAAMIGMTTRAYLPYERGERSQGEAWLRVALAAREKTGVSLDWLFSGKESYPGTGTRNNHRPLFRYGANRRPAMRLAGGAS